LNFPALRLNGLAKKSLAFSSIGPKIIPFIQTCALEAAIEYDNKKFHRIYSSSIGGILHIVNLLLSD
jgi:hypothetical protein